MKHNITFAGVLHGGDDCDAECIEGHFDAIMEELTELTSTNTDVADGDLGVSLSDGTFDALFYVEAPDLATAAQLALTVLRTAFHAAGVSTPGHGGWSYDLGEARIAVSSA